MSKKCSSILVVVLLFVLCYSGFTYGMIKTLPLKKGMKGVEVKELQHILLEMGFDITLDSVFGLETEKIIKEFQQDQGLKADGIVGIDTLLKLKEVSQKNIDYEVQQGDTLSEIAEQFNVSISELKSINKLSSNKIKAGQVLTVPRRGVGDGLQDQVYKNTYHVVQDGDVLTRIASRYGVSVDTIRNANNLRSDLIQIGQRILIPYTQVGPSKDFKLEKGAFIWPVKGRLSSGYGYRIHPILRTRHFHGGIDIAVDRGTPILAAAGGKVIRAGWISNFGKTVVIDHGNDITTLYAHNSSIQVKVGDMVHVGQIIARAGSTGQSTGIHLDFRIMCDEVTVNPLLYLP